MTPGHSDPHNHVPEVSGNDARDDAESVVRLVAPTPIPSRGTRHGAPPPAAAKTAPGLRIDSPVRVATSKEVQRLEVEEISPAAVRLRPDAPPPRVERIVTFHKLADQSPESRGEGGDWGKSHSISQRWVFGMGAVVVVLVVGGIIALPYINAPNAIVVEAPSTSPPVAKGEDTDNAEALSRLFERQDEAKSIYRSFATAASPDDFMPLICHAAELEPVVRLRWEPTGLARNWVPAPDSGWIATEIGNRPCGLLSGVLPDGSNFAAYFSEENGHLLLDWKATTGYGSTSFKDLENGRGTGSEIRGIASIENYYSQSFPESDYLSLRLESPDREHYIWCYAKLKTPVAEALKSEFLGGPILEKSGSPIKVTFALEPGPDGSQPNQWLIRELLQIDWLSR